MTTPAQLDLLCQQFYRDTDAVTRAATAMELLTIVCASPPNDVVAAGRCAAILQSQEIPPSWQPRVDRFVAHVDNLLARHWQIDALGDENTDPEAIFDLLGDEIADNFDIGRFDPDTLRRTRVGTAHRAAAAEALLTAFGWDNLVPAVADELRIAMRHITSRTARYPSTAMLVDSAEIGVALGVTVQPTTTSENIPFSRMTDDMRAQSESVLRSALDGSGAEYALEWDVTFGGSSIGLGMWLAAKSQSSMRPDPLLAATGRIEAGRVRPVAGVTAKVRSAALSGYRRILVAGENLDEANAAVAADAGLIIHGVDQVDEIPRVLAETDTGTALGMDGALRIIRRLLPLYHLDHVDERPILNGHRIVVADAGSEARVDVYSGRRATVKPTGKGTALVALERLIAERLPRTQVQQRGNWTVLVRAADRREKFLRGLRNAGAEGLPTTSQYETFRYRYTEGASSALTIGFTSDKIQVPPGQAPAHDRVTDLLAAAVDGLGGIPPRPSDVQREQTPNVSTQTALIADDELVPHIGTDEAGKGDYFGPLVCAACYLDTDVARILRQLGVRDSKTLSEKTIRRLAQQIRAHLPGRFAVVTLKPGRYNSLYAELKAEGKNLNSLVAWGHARGIQDLFGHGVWAEYAVIDKFADERYLHERLRRDTRRRDMRLEHRTKAESDVAVAAASILARSAFVEWFDEAAKTAGIPLPKGAGPPVIDAARELVRRHGADALREYAKVSFKTTQRVLGS